jgi:hypothetical protein
MAAAVVLGTIGVAAASTDRLSQDIRVPFGATQPLTPDTTTGAAGSPQTRRHPARSTAPSRRAGTSPSTRPPTGHRPGGTTRPTTNPTPGRTGASSPTRPPTTRRPTDAPQPTRTATPPRPSGPPNAANTGVPAGTQLRRIDGDLTISTPGTVLQDVDVHGFVTVTAPNVTIRSSIVRGGRATGDAALITDLTRSATNLRIEDTELTPEFPSVRIDGLRAYNYTAVRVDIHGTVDGAKIFGDDVTIKDSYIHDLAYFGSDPHQHGGPTHNDGVQIGGGRHIRLIGNTIRGGDNAAVMVTQGVGAVSDLVVAGNWLGGGACTVNLAAQPLGGMSGVTVSGNRFFRDSSDHCPLVRDDSVAADLNDDLYLDDGGPIAVIVRRT